jgi:hypothetical protein
MHVQSVVPLDTTRGIVGSCSGAAVVALQVGWVPASKLTQEAGNRCGWPGGIPPGCDACAPSLPVLRPGNPILKIEQPIGKFLAQPIRAHASQRFPAYDVSHRRRLQRSSRISVFSAGLGVVV